MKKITRRPSPHKSYIGYCRNSLHKGHITLETAREHGCFEKGCRFFSPDLQHPIYTNKDYTSKKVSYKALSRMKTAARALAEKRVSH